MTLRQSITLLAVAFSGFAAIPTASAQSDSQYGESDFGVGVMVGSPTGLSAKKYLAESHAVDGALGWGYGGTRMHADYLYEQRDVLGESDVRLGWFVGIGGKLGVSRYGDGRYYNRRYHRHDDYRRRDYLHIGARVPLGLELRFQSIPKLEFFGELALGFEIIEYPGPTLDAGIGTRFYF